MNRATSFDDVSYSWNQFRGDLIVTPGVLYYFPHTNVAAAKLESKDRPTEHLGFFTHLIGWPGLAIQVFGEGLDSLSGFLWRTFRATINQPDSRESGLWHNGESAFALQERLDAHLAQSSGHSPPLVGYEYSLPKPIRFSRAKLHGLTLKRGTLSFDTEFDHHEFRIGFRRQKLLREVLWEAGFLGGNDAQLMVEPNRRQRER